MEACDIKEISNQHSTELTPLETSRLIFLFIFGYRIRAIQIMGREVMQPLGLVGLGLVTLDESGPEIREVGAHTHIRPEEEHFSHTP
jgi:hypothetical protein